MTGGAAGAAAWLAPRDSAARIGRSARSVLPGLMLPASVGLVAHLTAAHFFPYALAVGFEVPLAMILGLVVINPGGAPGWAMPGIRFAVPTS